MIRQLYFFRHGLTDWNQQRRLQGHSNIPLNAEGEGQAQALRAFFLAHPVDHVFSSDLQRAVRTAILATDRPEHQIIRHSGLREVHLGELEGLHEDEINQKYGEELMKKWRSFEDPDRHFSLPGGESREACNQRMRQAILDLCGQYSFQAAAICSHGFALRRLFHLFLEEKILPEMVGNCVIYRVNFDDQSSSFHMPLSGKPG